MKWKDTFRKGILEGIKTLWILGKIIFPVTLLVTLLQYTPIMTGLIYVFEPIMAWFGLPGDAAIVLVLGKLLGIYASIGAILPMEMTVKQIFIIAVMVSFSHNLIVETAVTKRIGVSVWSMLTVRIGLAFLSGFLLHKFWHGGSEIAQYTMTAGTTAAYGDWYGIKIYALKTALYGIFQVAVIVIPLMFFIQIIRDLNILQGLSKLMKPLTSLIGVSDRSALTLMAGLVFGIAYGAGLMIQAAKEDGLSARDIYLVSIFLVICHAVIEDTLLFLPLGIPLIPLLLLRLVLAIILTIIISLIWRKSNKGKQQSQQTE
jgi:hypothetical protein